MANIVMAQTVMAHVVMAQTVMAYIVMAQTVMAHIVMAQTVMACESRTSLTAPCGPDGVDSWQSNEGTDSLA